MEKSALSPLGQFGHKTGVSGRTDQNGRNRNTAVGNLSEQGLIVGIFHAAVGYHDDMPCGAVDVQQCIIGLFHGGNNHSPSAGGQAIQGTIQIKLIGRGLNGGRPSSIAVKLDNPCLVIRSKATDCPAGYFPCDRNS